MKWMKHRVYQIGAALFSRWRCSLLAMASPRAKIVEMRDAFRL
jgi:hypothetical protein